MFGLRHYDNNNHYGLSICIVFLHIKIHFAVLKMKTTFMLK